MLAAWLSRAVDQQPTGAVFALAITPMGVIALVEYAFGQFSEPLSLASVRPAMPCARRGRRARVHGRADTRCR